MRLKRGLQTFDLRTGVHVAIAVEAPLSDLMRKFPEANQRGLQIADEDNMTAHPGVFEAGDVVHGSLCVVHAVNDAKNAAAAMIRYMEEHG